MQSIGGEADGKAREGRAEERKRAREENKDGCSHKEEKLNGKQEEDEQRRGRKQEKRIRLDAVNRKS